MNIPLYQSIVSKLSEKNVTLVAVSKTKPANEILALYNEGQKDFGENYVQELLEKQNELPNGIRWHFIGHLQSNKAKYIVPFVHLIHSVDSEKLLAEIDKQALKNKKIINCLLQIYIAQEETKFGLDFSEAEQILINSRYYNVKIIGLMGMASNTENTKQIAKEYESLKNFYNKMKATIAPQFQYLSTGMSGDFETAIKFGATHVRVGSALFGTRVSPA
jgi:pyridoxal phosphate enzyme (YggS family)